MDPSKSYPGLEASHDNRAMRIVEIAFMALVDDAKQLVAEGVRHDIARCISQASSVQERESAIHRGKEREGFLKTWLGFKKPLAYYQRSVVETTLPTLIQAVVSSPGSIIDGLPNLHKHRMTQKQFVDSLLTMTSPLTANPTIYAPVMKKGSFFPLLVEARRALTNICPDSGDDADAVPTFVRKFFTLALDHLDIRFVPSHPPRTEGRGSPLRAPVFNSWAHLGLRDFSSAPKVHIPVPSSSQRDADIAHENAVADDSLAAWSTAELTIDTLYTVLRKTRLPFDFVTPTRSDVAYVDETYTWVRTHYDGSKSLHHLALLVAIIAASLLPRLFADADNTSRSAFSTADTPEKVRRIYEDVGWIAKKKKGMLNKSIFVAMFTTFIIALYEKDSPLRKRMKKSGRQGLGEPWTKKHSLSLSYFLPLSAPHSSGYSPQICFLSHSDPPWRLVGYRHSRIRRQRHL